MRKSQELLKCDFLWGIPRVWYQFIQLVQLCCWERVYAFLVCQWTLWSSCVLRGGHCRCRAFGPRLCPPCTRSLGAWGHLLPLLPTHRHPWTPDVAPVVSAGKNCSSIMYTTKAVVTERQRTWLSQKNNGSMSKFFLNHTTMSWVKSWHGVKGVAGWGQSRLALLLFSSSTAVLWPAE